MGTSGVLRRPPDSQSSNCRQTVVGHSWCARSNDGLMLQSILKLPHVQPVTRRVTQRAKNAAPEEEEVGQTSIGSSVHRRVAGFGGLWTRRTDRAGLVRSRAHGGTVLWMKKKALLL